jgi:hypothetical protein
MTDEQLQEILAAIEARQAVFEAALAAVIADLDAIYAAAGEEGDTVPSDALGDGSDQGYE